MKVTVTSLENECFMVDVSEDLELENFKAFCEVQSGISAQEITIEYQGVALVDNKKTLKDYNIQDGDLVLIKRVRAPVSNNGTGKLMAEFFLLIICVTMNGNCVKPTARKMHVVIH